VGYYASRETVERTPPGCYPVHREFYHILDNATRGFSAWRAAYKLGMAGENFTVKL
jgi:hypothetical protein